MCVYVFLLVTLCCLPLVSATSSRDLATLQGEFFTWQMSEHPLSATYRDIHQYNDQLQVHTLTRMTERKARADEFLGRLRNISETGLSKTDMVNYRIMADMLETYIQGYELRHYQNLNPVNFREGPQQGVSVSAIPFYTRGDFENYLVRLHKLPLQYEEYKVLMREAISLGRTYHYHSLSRIEEQFASHVVPANMSQFYSPFLQPLDQTDIADKEELRQRGLVAVEGVLRALYNLSEFMSVEYMDKSRADIGISSLEGGADYYAACIRWYLSDNMTAREVHDIGLTEVDRITNSMRQIMSKQGFYGSPGDYYRTLLNNSDFVFNNGEEMMEEFRHQIFEVIDPKLDKYFNNNPQLPLEVREMTYDGPRGAYSSGSADGTRPGVFWANIRRPRESANFTLMSLTAHEANPGHHMQISISITSDTPDFRQKMLTTPLYHVPFSFPRYTAYVEGWALYTEYLGEEMGIYRDDYELMGRYSGEMFRACRLVVDTGIHAFNWTREEAIDYFLNYTAQAYDAVAVEIDRYITWPGQALAYKIGEIKIKQLRQLAETRLGSRFDIRDFHSVVLDSGTVPLSVLEGLVTDWLDSYPMATPAPDTTTIGSTCAGVGVVTGWAWLLALIISVSLS